MSKYYLVVLDETNDIEEIIHSPKKIFEFIKKDHERKAKTLTQKVKRNSSAGRIDDKTSD